MKIVTIISGVVLALTGVFCIARAGTTFLAVAFILGLAMLIHGIMSIVSCITEKRHGYASGYILADGAIAIILSVVVLSNQLVSDAVIPVFFGMWLLFSCTMHTMQSLVVRGSGESSWRFGMGFGIAGVLAGISAFVYPITARADTVLLLGIYFALQGISVTMLGVHFKDGKRRKGPKTAENERK